MLEILIKIFAALHLPSAYSFLPEPSYCFIPIQKAESSLSSSASAMSQLVFRFALAMGPNNPAMRENFFISECRLRTQ